MSGLAKGIPKGVFEQLEAKVIADRKANPIVSVARAAPYSDASGEAASSSLLDASVSSMGLLYSDSEIDAAFSEVVGKLNAVKAAYEALEADHNTLLAAHKALVVQHNGLVDKFDGLRDACAEMGIVG